MKQYFISFLFVSALSIITLNAQETTTLKLPTDDATSSFQVTDNDDLVRMQVDGDGDFLIMGGIGGTVPREGNGTRMMFYPSKAAFRAGYVEDTQWDDDSIGGYSFASGHSTTAKGTFATAMGGATVASGNFSFASGSNSISSGIGSTAMGHRTTASGVYSTAIGDQTSARGQQSIAAGGNTIATGDYSSSFGHLTYALSYSSFVIGQYNLLSGVIDSWVATDPLFVCGNGTDPSTRTNALTLFKNGDMTIAGTLTENSDRRLKENIEPLGNVLQSLNKINSVYYEFKDKQTHPAGTHIGLIAQEVQDVFPELITEDSEGILSVEYTKFTAVLLQAVKEQQEMIENQNSELRILNDKLKTENEVLKARLNRIEMLLTEKAEVGKKSRIAQNK